MADERRFTVHLRLALLMLCLCGTTHGQSFSFVALGDTAYNGERDYSAYRALIGKINAAQGAFAIHVGDIWGVGDCHDQRIQQVREQFQSFAGAVIYTPGDNEWVDCDQRTMGGYEPGERLEKLRQVFFADDRSLGRKPIRVVRQSAISPYQLFAENQRWVHEGVLFFTLNVPGSNNNYKPENLLDLTEAYNRNQANVAWIRDCFRVALAENHAAVVVAFHADLFDRKSKAMGAYRSIVDEIRLAADRYGKPVLLVHGDSHKFMVDRPLLKSRGEAQPPLHANVTRLQVFGAPELKAVRVTVDLGTPWVFGFAPLY
jgi:hypothetical protein